jgi:DNA-binding IclR family transcriptional regulator
MKLARTTTGKYNVEAVSKALDLLETFSGPEELGLNEICRRAAIGKTRAFRLLHTLAAHGYVERCADGSRYQLGAKLCERAAQVRRNIRELARPWMRRLHERFNETVNLGVLHQREVLYIDILETARPFRMTATIGSRMPAHRTAMGKAMLAHCNPRDPESAGGAPPVRLRPSARRALLAELEQARKCGFAVDDQENEPGVACVGAAILDAAGAAVAAISVSGPNYRILAGRKSIAREVMAACRQVSKGLGYQESAKKESGVRSLEKSGDLQR